MSLPKIIGDVYENEAEMVRGFADLYDFDSYREWYERFYSNHKHNTVNAEKKNWALASNQNELVKKTLEKIFRERESINLEYTNNYIGEYWIEPTVKKNMTTFLVLYQDFYREDKDFKAKLWQATVDYFKITREDMKYARNGWVPDWVKS